MCVFVTLFWTFIWSISAIVFAAAALHYKQFLKRLHDGLLLQEQLPINMCSRITVKSKLFVTSVSHALQERTFTELTLQQQLLMSDNNFSAQTALGPVLFSLIYNDIV